MCEPSCLAARGDAGPDTLRPNPTFMWKIITSSFRSGVITFKPFCFFFFLFSHWDRSKSHLLCPACALSQYVVRRPLSFLSIFLYIISMAGYSQNNSLSIGCVKSSLGRLTSTLTHIWSCIYLAALQTFTHLFINIQSDLCISYFVLNILEKRKKKPTASHARTLCSVGCCVWGTIGYGHKNCA